MVTAVVVALLFQPSVLPPPEARAIEVAPETSKDPGPEIVEWVDPSRVELRTPIGPLPFVIETGVSAYDESFSMAERIASYYAAVRVWNGDRATITRSVVVHASGCVPRGTKPTPRSFARIEFVEEGSTLSGSKGQSCVVGAPIADYMPLGTWTVVRGEISEKVSLSAKRAKSADDRFDPIDTDVPTADMHGTWLVRLERSDQQETGRLTVDGNLVEATLLAPGGQPRSFGGRIDGDLLRLSYFDGRDAYLIHARMQPDGSLRGELWEGDWHHEVWTAVREESVP